jgi:hypothetical protein
LLLNQLNLVRTANETKEIIHEYGFARNNLTALSSWYTARWIDVPNPSVYIEAALTGYKVWILSASILNLSDAIQTVRKIPGRDGVFSSPLRIGLPDEVLIFQTAHENERVLLLYSLLMLSEAIPEKVKLTFQIFPETAKWVVEAFGKKMSGEDL